MYRQIQTSLLLLLLGNIYLLNRRFTNKVDNLAQKKTYVEI